MAYFVEHVFCVFRSVFVVVILASALMTTVMLLLDDLDVALLCLAAVELLALCWYLTHSAQIALRSRNMSREDERINVLESLHRTHNDRRDALIFAVVLLAIPLYFLTAVFVSTEILAVMFILSILLTYTAAAYFSKHALMASICGMLDATRRRPFATFYAALGYAAPVFTLTVLTIRIKS